MCLEYRRGDQVRSGRYIFWKFPGNKSRGVTRYPSVEISGKKRRHSWTAAYGPVYAPLRQGMIMLLPESHLTALQRTQRELRKSLLSTRVRRLRALLQSLAAVAQMMIFNKPRKYQRVKCCWAWRAWRLTDRPRRIPSAWFSRVVLSPLSPKLTLSDSIRGNASPGLKAALHASAPSKIAYEQETSLDSDREHDIRNSTLSWGNEEEPDECEGGEIIKEKEKTKKIMPLAERRLLVEPTKKRKFLLDDDALDEFDNKPMRNVERYNLRLNIKSSPPPIARQTKTRRTWNSLSASLSSTNLDTGSTKPPQALSPDPNTSLVPMAAIVCPSMEPPPTTHVRRCNSAPDMKPCASFNGSSDCFISSPVAQLAKKRDLRDYGTTLNTSGRPNESKPKHPNTPTESPRKRFRLSASPDPTITAVTHTSATSATTTTSDTTTYTTSTIAITTPETNVESTDIELERVCDVTVTPLDSQINESALTENEERRDIWPHLQLLKEPLERSEPQTPVKLEYAYLIFLYLHVRSADFSSPVFGSFDASSGSIFPVFSPYFQADCLPWPEHHNIRTLGGASDESLYEFWADPNEWLK